METSAVVRMMLEDAMAGYLAISWGHCSGHTYWYAYGLLCGMGVVLHLLTLLHRLWKKVRRDHGTI